MTEWWTCQTLPLPYTVCMSPPSASHIAIWDVLAYPRQFTAHFNIIHICWVKSNSKPPVQRSYDAMTHFKSLAHIKHAWAAKQFRKCKIAGHTVPYLVPRGTNPFWPDISRLLPWYFSTTVLVIFILSVQEKEEKRNKKDSAVMAGSECVEYIELLRHVKVCMLHLSGNNAIFWYTFAW